MPVVSKENLIPDWMSNPSVMDPWYKRVAGAVGRVIGADEPQSSLPTPASLGSVVVDSLPAVERRIAPKRAASALADVLLGRSPHIPEGAGLKPLSDEDAKLTALLQNRIGSAPPPPTELAVLGHPQQIWKPMTRVLPRNPGITDEYFNRRKLSNMLTPAEAKTGLAIPKKIAVGNPNIVRDELPKTARTAEGFQQRAAYKDVGGIRKAAEAGGAKVYTEREIKAMLEGPQKAYNNGLITRAQLSKMLAENQAKIEANKKALGLGAATLQEEAANKNIQLAKMRYENK